MEVDVVADVAIDRETPIAFSNVEPKQIQRELASQDLPMVLNSTPGIYATQQGGGDGDARINIRGFSQRNIAVMIDGVPVNDMENGWVYWSNWFGLDAITQKMQVQRGLGASKLAIPSVGGTLNILSKGIDQKGYTRIKQETGSNGFLRTSVGYNTGRLKGDWGVTFAGSYKRGDGWVDQTWTKGWFYYLKVEKKLGNHMLSLSGFGAPQSHGQRSFKINIADHDKEYARGLFEGSPELYDLMAQYNRGQIDQNELNQGLTTLGLTQDDYNSALTNFVDTMNGKDYGIRYNQQDRKSVV
jgi:outer membrane cobalamin receptor